MIWDFTNVSVWQDRAMGTAVTLCHAAQLASLLSLEALAVSIDVSYHRESDHV